MPAEIAIVVGHSHTGPLTDAVAARDVPRGPVLDHGLHLAIGAAWNHVNGDVPYVLHPPDGTDLFNPSVLNAAREACPHAGRTTYLALFGGHAHVVMSLIRHERPYDIVLPGRPDLPLEPGVEVAPVAIMRAVLEERSKFFFYQAAKLRSSVPDRVITFTPPPPNGDNVFLRDRLDAFFVDHWQTRELAPPALRLKLWLLQLELQRRHAAEHSLELMEPPEGSRTADGFLDPACYGGDATHGGLRYGELVLQQVEAALGTRLASWSTFEITGP